MLMDRKLSTFKESVLFKLIYRFNTILNSKKDGFIGIGELILGVKAIVE